MKLWRLKLPKIGRRGSTTPPNAGFQGGYLGIAGDGTNYWAAPLADAARPGLTRVGGYAGLCTLVHHKKRGGWSSSAGQASLKSLIIKNIQRGAWSFLSDARHTAQQERFLGEKGAAPRERRLASLAR